MSECLVLIVGINPSTDFRLYMKALAEHCSECYGGCAASPDYSSPLVYRPSLRDRPSEDPLEQARVLDVEAF
jgi:hypothetical protein